MKPFHTRELLSVRCPGAYLSIIAIDHPLRVTVRPDGGIRNMCPAANPLKAGGPPSQNGCVRESSQDSPNINHTAGAQSGCLSSQPQGTPTVA